jgi:hypothetical protein
MSIYVLFLAGPFIIRERREFTALILGLAISILLGGIGFLLLPARAAFPPPGELGVWTGLFHLADRLNLDHNMVPSLHVALSVACVAAFSRRANKPGRFALWWWAAGISASTLLTHQHHVLDVVIGWVVGVVGDQAGIKILIAPRKNFNFAAARGEG